MAEQTSSLPTTTATNNCRGPNGPKQQPQQWPHAIATAATTTNTTTPPTPTFFSLRRQFAKKLEDDFLLRRAASEPNLHFSSLRVHIANVHSPLVMEEDCVVAALRENAQV